MSPGGRALALLCVAPCARGLLRTEAALLEAAASAAASESADGLEVGHHCFFGRNHDKNHLCSRAANLWILAASQAGWENRTTSSFACNVMKYPAKWVKGVEAMRANASKIRNFNFVGSMTTKGPPMFKSVKQKRRAWVARFAKNSFGPRDIFQDTTPPKNYTPMGVWDLSLKRVPKETQGNTVFDPGYYMLMLQSRFTLCPGGDEAWSIRFSEAVLAGSIPVIDNEVDAMYDLRMAAVRCIGYHYISLARKDPFKYRQDWVDENLRLFYKYQTFMHGDQIPPQCNTRNATVRSSMVNATRDLFADE